MKFSSPLLEARFIRRYKRFFLEAETTDGQVITAHCANTGKMLGLLEEDSIVYLEPQNDPSRKLRYTWQMSQLDNTLVGTNTHLPNKILAEALENKLIEELLPYEAVRREVRYGDNSRIDFLLEFKDERPLYIEVKNVHHKEIIDGLHVAMFPDTVTTRGAKHLDELKYLVDQGGRAIVIPLVQREDVTHFMPAHHIDPAFGEKCLAAKKAGVKIMPFSCKMSLEGVKLHQPLEFIDKI